MALWETFYCDIFLFSASHSSDTKEIVVEHLPFLPPENPLSNPLSIHSHSYMLDHNLQIHYTWNP